MFLAATAPVGCKQQAFHIVATLCPECHANYLSLHPNG
jgi:hypothetical protein